MSDNKLSPKQKKGIEAIIRSSSIEDAARIAGVNSRTVYRWMDLDYFAQELRDQQTKIINNASRRMTSKLEKALDKLEELFDAESESVRRSAIIEWIKMCFEFREQTDIDRRLTELEKKL